VGPPARPERLSAAWAPGHFSLVPNGHVVHSRRVAAVERGSRGALHARAPVSRGFPGARGAWAGVAFATLCVPRPVLAPLTRLTAQARSTPEAPSLSARDVFSAPVRLRRPPRAT
jgi:hypothetical protein